MFLRPKNGTAEDSQNISQNNLRNVRQRPKKKGLHLYDPQIWPVIFYLCFLQISLFVDVYKKKSSDLKDFSGEPSLGRHPYVENHGSSSEVGNLFLVAGQK